MPSLNRYIIERIKTGDVSIVRVVSLNGRRDLTPGQGSGVIFCRQANNHSPLSVNEKTPKRSKPTDGREFKILCLALSGSGSENES